MRNVQRPSSVLISGVNEAEATSILARRSLAWPLLSSEMSTRNALASDQTVASDGLAWPRSICESMDRDTPDILASSSSVSDCRLRIAWMKGPICGEPGSDMPRYAFDGIAAHSER